MKLSTISIKIAAAAFVLTSIAANPVSAQQYEFLSPPNPDTNRMYRVNIKTGEMGACWYGRDKGIGFTDCRPVGEGAGPQKAGRYKLFATKFDSEKGVFRVNTNTGEMSLCWVRRGSLVCTVPNR
jgi:hypothetical protein